MSTAGKVLSVLTALAILGWIVLIASVADLNRNWGHQIDELSASIEKLDKDIEATHVQVQKTLADVRVQQEERDRELMVLRNQISKLAKLEAQNQQVLSDVTLEVKQVTRATEDANANNQKRGAEVEETKQQLAQARTEVQTLQQSVAGLLGELQRLQASFIATLKDNQQLLQQLRDRNASATPRTRPASFVR